MPNQCLLTQRCGSSILAEQVSSVEASNCCNCWPRYQQQETAWFLPLSASVSRSTAFLRLASLVMLYVLCRLFPVSEGIIITVELSSKYAISVYDVAAYAISLAQRTIFIMMWFRWFTPKLYFCYCCWGILKYYGLSERETKNVPARLILTFCETYQSKL